MGETKHDEGKPEKAPEKHRVLAGSYICAEKRLAVVKFENGSSYSGEWKGDYSFDPFNAGSPAEKGIHKLLDLETAVNGFGVLGLPDKSELYGQFKDGSLHGLGIMKRQLKGQKSGAPEGHAELRGEFKRGIPVGFIEHRHVKKDKSTTINYCVYSKGRPAVQSQYMMPVVYLYLYVWRRLASFVLRAQEKAEQANQLQEALVSRKVQFGLDGAQVKGVEFPPLKTPTHLTTLLGIISPAIIISIPFMFENTPFWVALLWTLASAGIGGYIAKQERFNNLVSFRNSKYMVYFFLTTNAICFTIYMIVVYPVVPGYLSVMYMTQMFLLISLHTILRRAAPTCLPKGKPVTEEEAYYLERRLGLKFSRVCNTCGVVRPPRAKHCRNCDACMDHFDHHCRLVAHCVGFSNHIHYYLFVIQFILLQLQICINVTLYIGSRFSQAEWDDNFCPLSFSCLFYVARNNILMTFYDLWALSEFLLQLQLFYEHTGYFLHNMSTNEIINWKKYRYLHKGENDNDAINKELEYIKSITPEQMAQALQDVRKYIEDKATKRGYILPEMEGISASEDNSKPQIEGTIIRYGVKSEKPRFSNPFRKGWKNNLAYAYKAAPFPCVVVEPFDQEKDK